MNRAIDEQPASVWNRRRSIAHLLTLALANIPITLLVGQSYLQAVPNGTTLLGWCAAMSAFVSTALMLHTAVCVVSLPLVVTIPRRWFACGVCPLLFALMNVFVYADTVIYGLFRFHFNGMIMNVLTTAGAGDSVTVGRATLTSAALVIALIWWNTR